jgi:hypothetical protein
MTSVDDTQICDFYTAAAAAPHEVAIAVRGIANTNHKLLTFLLL